MLEPAAAFPVPCLLFYSSSSLGNFQISTSKYISSFPPFLITSKAATTFTLATTANISNLLFLPVTHLLPSHYSQSPLLFKSDHVAPLLTSCNSFLFCLNAFIVKWPNMTHFVFLSHLLCTPTPPLKVYALDASLPGIPSPR